ncbi:hypothetical protein D1007_48003 [Hordeum vulgare]|nr:hypothetical protein D1007_48003 [Hordeum vulgare]
MANPLAPSSADPDAAANHWRHAVNRTLAPLLDIHVTRVIPSSTTTHDNSNTTPTIPILSTPVDLEALRACPNEARAAAASSLFLPTTCGPHHNRQFGLPLEPYPLIVTPPSLINDVSHFAFTHLRTPIHNLAPVMHAAVMEHAGNICLNVAGTWHGDRCVTFEYASVREYLVSLVSINYSGNQITFEPVELADRASPVFDQLIEVKVVGLLHEL